MTTYIENLSRIPERVPMYMTAAAEATAKNTVNRIKRVFGDLDQLAPLAESTQAERESLGFTPNDPLLRTGQLRDSITSKIGEVGNGIRVEVGTTDPKMLFLELGTVHMPSRPAIQLGVIDADRSNFQIMIDASKAMVTGVPPTLEVESEEHAA
jgi:hypothetical protein